MKIRVRTLERYYGEQLANVAGIAPLINQLVYLDKIPALRYLVSSRRVFFKLVERFKKENLKKSRKSNGNSELVTMLNELYFGEDSYARQSNSNVSKEFNDLVSAIQNTVFVYFIDKLEIPKKKRSTILEGLKKGYKVINTVYGSIEGGLLEKETNTLFDFISSEIAEKSNEYNVDDSEKSVGIIEKDDVTHKFTKEPSNDNLSGRGEQDGESDEVELLTRKETAAIFGITLPTLGVWEKNGSIPKAIRTGSRVYFIKADIFEHIKSTKGDSD